MSDFKIVTLLLMNQLLYSRKVSERFERLLESLRSNDLTFDNGFPLWFAVENIATAPSFVGRQNNARLQLQGCHQPPIHANKRVSHFDFTIHQ